MQNLKELVEQWRRNYPTMPDQHIVNLIREYLQVIILKSIYHSKYSNCMSFMGGTALRICYDLKRFSEDLDFALDRPSRSYSFAGLLETVCKDIESQGYLVEKNISEEKTVQKSFIKFSRILFPLGLSHKESHKIHIKIEVDVNPIKVSADQMESFFVSKFAESFPILQHKLETSFAGKILAILGRKYTKGRDYYDLIWFLSRKTNIDIEYINGGLRQQLSPTRVANNDDIFKLLDKVVAGVQLQTVLKDIGRFLEDPKEEAWLKNYQQVYKQLSTGYMLK